MDEYRKILVGYDGSPSAKNALVTACRLARTTGSWLKVVASIPEYAGDLELVGISNIKEAIEGPGRALLEEAKGIAARENAHILTNLEQGEPFERIVRVAEEEQCDLIVMGRRGTTRLERELIGGVTARVIGHTTKDVLVVPDETSLSWETMVLATDGSPACDAAEKRAVELARKHRSALHVVTAVDINEEFFSQAIGVVEQMIAAARERVAAVGKRLEADGLAVTTHVAEGEPHEAITSYAGEAGAHLIIMGSHGRKGLSRVLMGSVTQRVIGYTPCPVLVCHVG